MLKKINRMLRGRILKPAAHRPCMQSLEKRLLFAVQTVTNLADHGNGSLADTIIESSAGDTIEFAPNLTGTITLTRGVIVIDHDVTIDGPASGQITVNGNDQGPIFLISDSTTQTVSNVSISNLTLTHGRNNGTIPDVSAEGGAIAAYNGNLSLTNVTITNSESIGQSGMEGAGGAVFFVADGNHTLSLTNCNFSNNSAIGGANGGFAAGGAVAVTTQSGGDTTIQTCTFTNNQAIGGDGGSSSSHGLLGPSYMEIGSAAGGAVATFGTSLFLFDSSLLNNVAQAGSGADGSNLPPGATGYLIDTGMGGGVAALGFTISVFVQRSTFDSNTAAGGSNTSINQSPSFLGSYGGCGLGGGLGLGGSVTANVGVSQFTSNQALGGDNNAGFNASGLIPAVGNGRGGGIYIYNLLGGRLNVSASSILTHNLARGGNGGKLRATTDPNDTTPVGLDYLSGLLDEGAGGGIAGDLLSARVNISSSTVTGNSAIGGSGGSAIGAGAARGGGVAAAPAIETTLILDSDTVSGNQVLGGNGTAGIDNGQGAGVGAPGEGGGVFGVAPFVSNCTVTGNLAAGGHGATGAAGGAAMGGGMYGAGTAFTNFAVEANIARGGAGGTGAANGIAQGGGCYVGGNVSFTASTVDANAADQGAGIYVFNGTLAIATCTIANNGAKTGGGLYDNSDQQLTISDSTIAGNRATGQGASVYNNNAATAPIVTNTILAAGIGGDWAAFPIASGNHNLVADGSGGLSAATNLLGTVANPITVSLAPLANYGGAMKTMALLPGSPAIDAGATTAATDERGISRPQGAAPDIGAFESQGFKLTLISGNNQSTIVGTPFANPLVVNVTANAPQEPTIGGQVKFTVPTSGASAINPQGLSVAYFVLDAEYSVEANATAGTYQVVASLADAAPVTFTLTNIANNTLTASPVLSPVVTIAPGASTSTIAVATFTDTAAQSLSHYAATINWGDGHTSAGAITVAGGVFTVKGANVYSLAGTYSPQVTITKDALTPNMVTDTSRVHVVAPTTVTAHIKTVGGTTFTGVEGRTISPTVGNFTTVNTSNPASSYSAMINWGDGSASRIGTVVSTGGGHFHIVGTHVYQDSSAGYSITITLKDIYGETIAFHSKAKIIDAPLELPTGKTLSVAHNTRFNKVIGSFRDDDATNTSAGNYVGTINWGDGTVTSAATFVRTGSTGNLGSYWNVIGTHKYATKKTYTVTFNIYDIHSPGNSILGTTKITAT